MVFIIGGNMKAENPPLRNRAEKKPVDVLLGLVGVFESKGWLNQTLRIKHRDIKISHLLP